MHQALPYTQIAASKMLHGSADAASSMEEKQHRYGSHLERGRLAVAVLQGRAGAPLGLQPGLSCTAGVCQGAGLRWGSGWDGNRLSSLAAALVPHAHTHC